MLKPINSYNTKFKADNKTIDEKTGEYRDPLMHWPLRGAAFTNEIGEAFRPLIGGYATLTWVPALLYIGADIYDKYKNDQTEYSPDSRRCLKQAIFQGLASILLPIVAVKGGQNLFSLIGLASKDGITINAKEQILELAQLFVANGKMRAYDKRDTECINDFLYIVDNNLSFKEYKKNHSNPIRKFFSNIFEVNNKEKIDKYAQKYMDKLIRIRKSIINSEEIFNLSELHQIYSKALENGQTKNVAIKSVLTKYLNDKSLKGKYIKTVGGFLALGLCIKPIDHFVDKVLIGKVVAPTLDKTKKSAI